MQPGDIAKWVTAHSDYIYVGQKLDSNAPANKIVLYEGFKDHGDGCNILFNDGHVEFVMKGQAMDWIKAFEKPE